MAHKFSINKHDPFNKMMSSFSSKHDGPIDLQGCVTYLKIQLNRLGALAQYYDVVHLQYDQMPEPARTELGSIARKIMILGQHLVNVLGPDHPLTEELCNMIHMVGPRVMCLWNAPVPICATNWTTRNALITCKPQTWAKYTAVKYKYIDDNTMRKRMATMNSEVL